jgi:hypothetical protein
MSSNGYFDEIENTLFARSVESWADYTNWSTLTSWGGTPSSLLEFTTNIIDAGSLDWHLPLLTFNSGAPVITTVQYGNTVDSTGGAIDSPSTATISPDTADVPGIYARFFKFTLTQGTGDSAGAEDSAGSPVLFLNDFNVGFNNSTLPLSQSDIDTSTLGGSVGARQLTFEKETGKITNCIIQPHITGLDDSGGDPVRPLIYIDKTSTPLVLNIFDADSYGKARRIDCTVDVQIQYLPICFSSANGQTEVVIN